MEADQAYYTKSQRAVLFCFDWTNICESIMRLHLQTRAEEAVGVCFHPFHLPFTAPPPSRVFNIKVCSLTGVSLKQGLFCWGLPPTGQERQELVNPCSVRKEDEETGGRGPGQNWLFCNIQKRLFRCLAVGMKLNNLISVYEGTDIL